MMIKGETTPIAPQGGYPQANVYVQPPQPILVQHFRDTPLRLRCQFCQAEVVTSTYYDNGTLTWLACFVIFWL